MMMFRIFSVLVITATASGTAPGGPNAGFGASAVSAKCKEEVKGIQNKEKAAAVGACEKKAKYAQQAVAHLQSGDRSAAISTIEESFQTCAKFSESCAKELAPRVIQQLEFSGAAVSSECKQTVAKIQRDQKKMKEVATCEAQNKVVENVLVALNNDDLKAALGAAETGLEKCSHLSEQCARQIAPVIVNQVVLSALAEQQQQGGQEIPTTTVLASVPSLPGSEATNQLSLIGTAVNQRGLAVQHAAFPKKHFVSFLQRVDAPQRFVSRMIMQMAR